MRHFTLQAAEPTELKTNPKIIVEQGNLLAKWPSVDVMV
jgi:hypothetical protein